MLVTVHRVLGMIAVRSPWFERVIKGSELVLYENRTFDHRAMMRAGFSRGDLVAAARQSGIDDFAEVRTIYKEATGKLSVISYSSREPRSQPGRHGDPLA
jgi:uncharacterized membrane protein YcaP (DUF421 family)